MHKKIIPLIYSNRHNLCGLLEIFLKYHNLISYENYRKLCATQNIIIHSDYTRFATKARRIEEEKQYRTNISWYVERAGVIWHTKTIYPFVRSAVA